MFLTRIEIKTVGAFSSTSLLTHEQTSAYILISIHIQFSYLITFNFLIKKNQNRGCIKKCPVLFTLISQDWKKATVLNGTFLISILKELSKTVFKSFLRQF